MDIKLGKEIPGSDIVRFDNETEEAAIVRYGLPWYSITKWRYKLADKPEFPREITVGVSKATSLVNIAWRVGGQEERYAAGAGMFGTSPESLRLSEEFNRIGHIILDHVEEILGPPPSLD